MHDRLTLLTMYMQVCNLSVKFAVKSIAQRLAISWPHVTNSCTTPVCTRQCALLEQCGNILPLTIAASPTIAHC